MNHPDPARPGAPSGPYAQEYERLDASAPPRPALTSRQKILRWGALSGALCVVAAVVVVASLPSAQSGLAASPLIGQRAPAVDGPSINGGAPVDTAAMQGRYVVVNFFASWCDPCGQEAPDLEQFSYQSARSGTATVIGVVYSDDPGSARRFLTSTGATFQAVDDPGSKLALAYGVRGPPETFVISPTGIVVAHIDGPVTDSQLASLITSRTVSRG